MAKITTPIQFLQWYKPAGPWQIHAGKVDPKPKEAWAETRTFADPKKAQAFIEKWNGKRNLYFTVNPLRPNADPNKKPSKTDIAALEWLHVDCDARENEDIEKTRARTVKELQKFKPRPSCIIMSGGGAQGFWRLAEPIPAPPGADIVPKKGEPPNTAWAPLEAYNKHLEDLLANRQCFNIDRVMRLPFTQNLPNATKRSKGRVPVPATLVESPGQTHPLGDFEAAPGPTEAHTSRSGPARGPSPRIALPADLPEVDLGDLPLDMRWKIILRRGYDPGEPDLWPSRSEVMFAAVCTMARAGMPDDLIASALLDRDLGISAHVLAQPNPRQYAARQIQRAKEKVHG